MTQEEFGGGWSLLRVGGSGMAAILVVLGILLLLLRPDLEDVRPPRDTTLYPGQPVGITAAPGRLTLPQPPTTDPSKPSEDVGSTSQSGDSKAADEKKPDDAPGNPAQPPSASEESKAGSSERGSPSPEASQPRRPRFSIIGAPPLPPPPPGQVPKTEDKPASDSDKKDEPSGKPPQP
ncbi:MAG: hypothetical protein NZM31_09920 [Gemmatales bacterium]|nr:hypothetical protein [Gemmatales bacterium]MDW8387311.1 hypothetical protein [Gemmatales bacterium]